jgi:hypothetical protein
MAVALLGGGSKGPTLVQFATSDVNNTRWYFSRESIKSVVVADPIVQTGDGEAKRAFALSLNQFDGGSLDAMYFDEQVRNQRLLAILLQLGIDNKLPLE